MVGMYGAPRDHGVRRLAALLERFRAIELPTPDGARVSATFSAGIAQYPADATDLQRLYREADDALYLAKTHGRARILPAGWEPPDPA